MTIVGHQYDPFIISKSSLINFVIVFLAAIVFKFALDWSYQFIIYSTWSRDGLLIVFSELKYVESYLLLLLIILLMPRSPRKLSNFIAWILIAVSYIPLLTVYAYMDLPRPYMYAVTGFWIIVFQLVKFKGFRLKPVPYAKTFLIGGLIAFYAVVISILFSYSRASINFDLSQVYGVRALYFAQNIPMAGYFFPWMANVVNPFVFTWCLIKRNWLPLTGTVILQLWLFFTTGYKSFLFIIPFVFLMIWVAERKNPLLYIVSGATLSIISGVTSYLLAGDLWLSSLSAYRVFIMPAHISFLYFDYFSSHEFIYMAYNKFVAMFIYYPYELSPPNLIGQVYFNSPTTEANNGIYSDAYMNFGFAGLFIWAIVIAVIFKVIDALVEGKDGRLALAAIAMPCFLLSNGQLTTCLMTHGLLLGLLIILLIPLTRSVDCKGTPVTMCTPAN